MAESKTVTIENADRDQKVFQIKIKTGKKDGAGRPHYEDKRYVLGSIDDRHNPDETVPKPEIEIDKDHWALLMKRSAVQGMIKDRQIRIL